MKFDDFSPYMSSRNEKRNPKSDLLGVVFLWWLHNGQYEISAQLKSITECFILAVAIKIISTSFQDGMIFSEKICVSV